MTIIQNDLKNTRIRMDSVERRLNELRSGSGLLDYKSQAKELTKGYVKSIGGNSGTKGKEEISTMMRSLEQNGGEFHRLFKLNDLLIKEYGNKQSDERHAMMDVSKVLTYTNVVVYPEVSDKKVYPIRWLIVLVATGMAVLLCYILVFLRDRSTGASMPINRG